MKYKVITHDYDRTPDGNVPKSYIFEADNDIEAILACANSALYGQIVDEDVKETAKEYVEDMGIEMPKTVEEVDNIVNDNYDDPSDGYIHAILNLDDKKVIFESNLNDESLSYNDWNKNPEKIVDSLDESLDEDNNGYNQDDDGTYSVEALNQMREDFFDMLDNELPKEFPANLKIGFPDDYVVISDKYDNNIVSAQVPWGDDVVKLQLYINFNPKKAYKKFTAWLKAKYLKKINKPLQEASYTSPSKDEE